MKRSIVALAALAPAAAVALWCGAARAQEFSYQPPGQLVAGSGEGRVDNNVYAPGMRYPVEAAPSFANSQVWGHGGGQGPGGSQCDVENFSYPWWDNYCETRQWDMPLCPSGTGHQGQDIRAATCDDDVHWVVASEAGSVTNIGTYSVYITAADGTRYDYLHMGSVQVVVGQEVAKGERIGKVSNEFGGTPTTVHLHFNLRQNVQGVGNVYVPPYLSLVTSYQALIGPPVEPATGSLDVASCETIGGTALSPADPDLAIEARLYFDGARGDGATVGHAVLADAEGHGFEVGPPLSLFDGIEHSVRAYGSDGTGDAPELDGSPKTFTCTFEVPSGVRRRVESAEAAAAWRFSSFWDEVSVSQGVLASLPEGPALGAAPRVVRAAADASKIWVVDQGVRRALADLRSTRAWDFHADYAEVLSDADLAAIPEGQPMRPRPVVLASNGELWLVDEANADEPPAAGGGDDGAGEGPDAQASCACGVPGGDRTALGFVLAAALLAAGFARRRG